MELLSCMSALNPSNSFASFDAQKVRRLAEFYPKDIFGSDLVRLELQLDTYIDVMRHDDRFSGLENLVDLSVKLVETNRHNVYDLVYLLLKMVFFYRWRRQVLRGHFLVWILSKPNEEIK